MYHGEIYIAPNYTLEECKRIFRTLNAFSTTNEWCIATDILIDRMNAGFFDAINLLSDQCDDRRGHNLSFSIMALNCLLIETLQQFYEGNDTTPGGNEVAFKRFFDRSPHFHRYFNGTISNQFYSNVRCGILHQAQTKRNVALEFNGDIMVQHKGRPRWLVFNTKAISHALHNEFVDYIERLKSDSELELRHNFVRKMRFIVQKAESRASLSRSY